MSIAPPPMKIIITTKSLVGLLCILSIHIELVSSFQIPRPSSYQRILHSFRSSPGAVNIVDHSPLWAASEVGSSSSSSKNAQSPPNNGNNNNYDNDFNNLSADDAQRQAEQFRSKAQALKAEAMELERELNATRSLLRRNKEADVDDLIDSIFSEYPIKSKDVAQKIRIGRYTTDLIVDVVERLYVRRKRDAGDEAELERLSDALDTLLEAATMLDSESLASSSSNSTINGRSSSQRWNGRGEQAIRAKLNELRRADEVSINRKFAAEVNAIINSGESVEEYVRKSQGLKPLERAKNNLMAGLNRSVSIYGEGLSSQNTTSKKEKANTTTPVLVPSWIPSVFLRFMLSSKPSDIGKSEVQQIKDSVLLGSRFYVTASESVPGAAYFRGNIRTPKGTVNNETSLLNHTAIAFAEIQDRMEKEGLDKNIQLFLISDPLWRPYDSREPAPKPVILALSKAVVPIEKKVLTGAEKIIGKIGRRVAYPLAILSTLVFSISAFALNPTFYNSVIGRSELKSLSKLCKPIITGILSIHAVQEVAHYLAAKKYKIKVGFSFPIPFPKIGIFGCITPLRSFPACRKALLDFSLSGPLATACASIACLIGGMFKTVYASPAALPDFPVVAASMFKSSFLVGTLASWFAPKVMMIPGAQPIPVHPLVLIGYAGVVSSGLNLLPIFRLDGGRACSAALGPGRGAVISVSTILFLVSAIFSPNPPIIDAFYGSIILFLKRRTEIPCRDEFTKVDNFRLYLWFFSFLFSMAAVVPFPKATGTVW